MKVVINNCYGGFSLSDKAVKRYLELKGKKSHFYENTSKDKVWKKINPGEANYLSFCFTKDFGDEFEDKSFKVGGPQSEEYKAIWDNHFSDREIKRNDPDLIKTVEELGKKANGSCAELKIIEIPNRIDYHIEEYDGMETIDEDHRSWS